MSDGKGVAVGGMCARIAGMGVASGASFAEICSGLNAWQAASSRLPASTQTVTAVIFPTWQPDFTLQLTVIPPT